MWDINRYFVNVYHNLDDLVLAFCLVLATVYICDFLRELVLYDGRLQLDLFPRYIVAEVIGTFEATAISFEISLIIYDVFGVFLFTLATFLSMVWQSLRAPEYQYQANPLHVIVKHVQALGVVEEERRDRNRQQDDQETSLYRRYDFSLIMLWAEGLGSCIAYFYIIYAMWRNAHYWKIWKRTNFHVTRYRTVDQWKSSMKEGPITAAIVECVFSCIQYLWPLYVNYRHFDGYSAVILQDFGKAIFAGMGAWYSGGYYNPIVGSVLEITTKDYSSLTIIFVYWLAPFLGTGIGFLLGEIS